MNTNTDPFEIPDANTLEKLANEFFKAIPGALNPAGLGDQQGFAGHNPVFSNQHIPSPLTQGAQGYVPSAFSGSTTKSSGFGVSPFSMDRGFPAGEIQSGLPESYIAYQKNLPKSVSGIGVSPGVLGVEKITGIGDFQNLWPDPDFAGMGKIPKSVGGSGLSPSVMDDHQGKSFSIKEPQTSLPDPHFAGQGKVPHSVAGSGISPVVSEYGKTFSVSETQTSLPDPHFASQGIVPQSVAGSGVSPSVMDHQGQSFDVKEPQTSLPDPHFAGEGIVPKSVAGSGVSPSSGVQGNPYNDLTAINGKSLDEKNISPLSFHPVTLAGFPPYGEIQPFESELTQILRSIKSPAADSPLPFTDQSSPDPLFYFLSPKNVGTYPVHSTDAVANYISIKENTRGTVSLPFDANIIKRDFPILQERVNGKQIVWLDNAATTQKPKQVIDRISYFYEHENSNIHRAAHELAARATDAYEGARKKIQRFLNAASTNEIIFVRGATEAINLVAKSWGEQYLQEGDEIVVSHLEHHANIVPWQQLAAKKGLKIRVIPVDDDGQVLLDEYGKLLGPKTRLVSFTQVSNALGTVTPAKRMVEMAHQAGARVLVDGAQSVSHMRVDVQDLNCDWFVFSGHKVFGPTGIGVVYGKENLLNETQPWQGGGNMIVDVTFEHTKYHQAPGRFEAGTGNIADAVGLGAAIDYVSAIGMEVIHQYEHYLLQYATSLMKGIPGLRMIGTASEKASVLSFVFEGFRTDEVGVALNQEGIAVRAGHHCAQPILRRFGVETTVRPSLAFYNTCSDIDRLVSTLLRLRATRRLRK